MIGFMISNGDNFQDHCERVSDHFDAISRLAIRVEAPTGRLVKESPTVVTFRQRSPLKRLRLDRQLGGGGRGYGLYLLVVPFVVRVADDRNAVYTRKVEGISRLLVGNGVIAKILQHIDAGWGGGGGGGVRSLNRALYSPRDGRCCSVNRPVVLDSE